MSEKPEDLKVEESATTQGDPTLSPKQKCEAANRGKPGYCTEEGFFIPDL